MTKRFMLLCVGITVPFAGDLRFVDARVPSVLRVPMSPGRRRVKLCAS
jgi:ABC-type cobalamin transport system permease subunit